MLTQNQALYQALQWRLWLFQLLLWLLLLPAYTSWSLAVFALLLLAKLWQLYRNGQPWSLGYSNLLAGTMLLALLLSARELGVMHLMFHFLLLAAVLRLLGLTPQRRTDVVQLIWVHYFLLACAFILHQDLWLAAIILAAFALNLYTQYLTFCTQIPQLRWRVLSRNAILVVLVTTALFVLFPRLPPLWQLPGAKMTQTGLTDALAPGAVGRLLQSDALAFRVKFSGQAPGASQRYFRAKVYDLFDGSTWRAQRLQTRPLPPADAGAQYSYTVVAEPHQQFSLFSLGKPLQHSQNTLHTNEALLVTEQPLSQRLSYQVASNIGPFTATGNINRYLQLPAGNPQSRELARQLRQNSANAATLVEQISQYFQQQQFRYSLTPGELSGAQIDQFLFERKIGFCSHYAGATVFLLRAAGIPARLVGGYLGGEWQDDGAYLQVLQKDAHAWVEYYQAGQWLSYDPTALIEPALLQETLSDATLGDFAGTGDGWMLAQLRVMLLQPLRDLDYYWSMWVLSFDSTQQQGLFGQLRQWQQELRVPANWWFWLLLPVVLSAVWYWRHRPKPDPTSRLFQPLLQLQPKAADQSYQQYLAQWAKQQPALAGELAQLNQCYLRWQFAGETQAYAESRQAMQQLLTGLKRLRS
jgi:transglutaminase-like putative cysteine protease